jgi:hypothetical protein
MFFERYTERARQVIVLAEEEARTLKHNYLGTEHILLGLLREEEGMAARVLESLDLTVERVRAQLVRLVGSGAEVTSEQIPITPRAKRILELAWREALELGQNYVDTEHILLGLVRENEGVASRILLDFDADSVKIYNEVIRMLTDPGSRSHGSGAVFQAPAPKQHFVRFVIHDGSGNGFAHLRDVDDGLRWVFAIPKKVNRTSHTHNAGDTSLRFSAVRLSGNGWLEIQLVADREIQTERWRQRLLDEGFVFVPEEA